VLGAIHAVLLLAGRLGDEQIGYQGRWQIGLQIEGLDEAAPIEAGRGPVPRDVYDRDVYEKTADAGHRRTRHQHTQSSSGVAALLRGLLVGDRYLPYTEQTLQK
jgi:hypothetical protein